MLAITLRQVSSGGMSRAGRGGVISLGSLDNQALTLLCDCVMQTKVAADEFSAALVEGQQRSQHAAADQTNHEGQRWTRKSEQAG